MFFVSFFFFWGGGWGVPTKCWFSFWGVPTKVLVLFLSGYLQKWWFSFWGVPTKSVFFSFSGVATKCGNGFDPCVAGLSLCCPLAPFPFFWEGFPFNRAPKRKKQTTTRSPCCHQLKHVAFSTPKERETVPCTSCKVQVYNVRIPL